MKRSIRLVSLMVCSTLLFGCSQGQVTFEEYYDMTVEEQISFDQEQEELIEKAVADLETSYSVTSYFYLTGGNTIVYIDNQAYIREGEIDDDLMMDIKYEIWDETIHKIEDYFKKKGVNNTTVTLTVRESIPNKVSKQVGFYSLETGLDVN